jgi:hypothetical protein
MLGKTWKGFDDVTDLSHYLGLYIADVREDN